MSSIRKTWLILLTIAAVASFETTTTRLLAQAIPQSSPATDAALESDQWAATDKLRLEGPASAIANRAAIQQIVREELQAEKAAARTNAATAPTAAPTQSEIESVEVGKDRAL